MPWNGYNLKPFSGCLSVPYMVLSLVPYMVLVGMDDSDVSFKR